MTLDGVQINIGDHLTRKGDELSYGGAKQILIHPKYRSGGYDSFPYDFCMIQTTEKMKIDGVKTQVACFPESGVHAQARFQSDRLLRIVKIAKKVSGYRRFEFFSRTRLLRNFIYDCFYPMTHIISQFSKKIFSENHLFTLPLKL